MADEEKGALRLVAWSEILPWLSIFRTFRLAIGLRVLVLSAVAVTLTVAGWWGFDRMFHGYGGYEALPHQVAPERPVPLALGGQRRARPTQPGLARRGLGVALVATGRFARATRTRARGSN